MAHSLIQILQDFPSIYVPYLADVIIKNTPSDYRQTIVALAFVPQQLCLRYFRQFFLLHIMKIRLLPTVNYAFTNIGHHFIKELLRSKTV